MKKEIITIIIMGISVASIYRTRWECRALYNNTNNTQTHTYKHMRTQTQACQHECMHTHTYTHAHTHAHAHTHTHTVALSWVPPMASSLSLFDDCEFRSKLKQYNTLCV